MVRVPLPQVPRQNGRAGFFAAPGTAPPADFTGRQLEQLGQATETAGLRVRQAALSAEDRLHTAAAKEAQALAEERILDADRAYRSRLGKDATGENQRKAWEDLNKQVEEIGDGLPYEVSRDFYRRAMQAEMLRTRARWASHEDQQIRAYEVGAARAALKAKQNKGALQDPFQDPEAAAVTLQSVKDEVRMLAEGKSEEETAAMVVDATTTVHSGRVRELVRQGWTTQAREYLAKAVDAGEVNADEVLRLRSILDRASVADRGVQVALETRDRLAAEHQKASEAFGPALPMDADTFLIRGLQDIQRQMEAGKLTPEERKAAQDEIERMAGIQKAAETKDTSDIARQAEQWMIDNPYAPVGALPPELYELVRMHGLEDDLNRFSGSDKRYSTNPAVFGELMLDPEIAAAQFAKPREQFLAEFRRQVSPSELEELDKMWLRANKSDVPGPNFDKEVKAALLRLPQDVYQASETGLSEEEKAARDLFAYNFYTAAKARWEGKGGKDATMKEAINEELQNLARTPEGDLKPVGAMTPEERIGISEDERIRMLYEGQRIPERGASLDTERLRRFWMRQFPGSYLSPGPQIPAALANAGTERLGQIPEAVRNYFLREVLPEIGWPLTEESVMAAWLIAKRPETVGEVGELGLAKPTSGIGPQIIIGGRQQSAEELTEIDKRWRAIMESWSVGPRR